MRKRATNLLALVAVIFLAFALVSPAFGQALPGMLNEVYIPPPAIYYAPLTNVATTLTNPVPVGTISREIELTETGAAATHPAFSQTSGEGLPPDTRHFVPKTSWRSEPLDGLSTHWERTEATTNDFGSLETRRNSYVEVASGLNYQDAPGGAWKRSVENIELMTNSGGAAALEGPLQVYFPPALGANDAIIRLVTPGKAELRIHPAALYYYDAKSGKSVLLARVRPADGELDPPTRVIYPGILEGLDATLVCEYRRSGFSSDLVLHEAPPPPDSFGLDPQTTRLELCHFLEGPEPQRMARVLKSERNPQLRAQMADPDWVDETLIYDQLRFSHGRAFPTGARDSQSSESEESAPVAKRLEVIGGQRARSSNPSVGRTSRRIWKSCHRQNAAPPPPALPGRPGLAESCPSWSPCLQPRSQ